jgi:hypothetical protein
MARTSIFIYNLECLLPMISLAHLGAIPPFLIEYRTIHASDVYFFILHKSVQHRDYNSHHHKSIYV